MKVFREKKNLNRFLLLVLILAGGLLFLQKPNLLSKKNIVKNITVAEFDEAQKSRQPFIVDVHVPEQPHISGTNAVIDYREVKKRISEFPKDKNAEIIVYCRSGTMSAEAAQDLADAGYTNVENLIGGANAYHEEHFGVEINPKTIDLGTVIYGEIKNASFILTNNTNAILKITRVTTSCSCTKGEVAEENLDPYASTELKVSFNPAVHKDDTDLGEITRTIYVETDNVNFPKVEAEITAEVVKSGF